MASHLVWPLPNVWLGVSVENQEWADKRIPLLLQTPAAKRFVSYEPALGPVDFTVIGSSSARQYPFIDCLRGKESPGPYLRDSKLDWIIIGGESGHNARPFDVAWARSVVRQCKEAGVACFLKQFGSKPIDSESEIGTYAPCDKRSIAAAKALNVPFTETWPEFVPFNLVLLKSSHGSDPAEWPEDLRVQEWPK